MRKEQCEMCDKELSQIDTLLQPHGWCMQCELLFSQTMQLVRCANRTAQCDSPITCLSAKKCVQIKAATITSSQVYETRTRLMFASTHGRLGVIAASSKVPEYALRDWIHNPAHFITQKEMIDVIKALDTYIPKAAGEGSVEGTVSL